MKTLDIKNLNLEIYDYDRLKKLFSYNINSELAYAGTYFVTSDFIKIIRLFKRENIKYEVKQNYFIEIK